MAIRVISSDERQSRRPQMSVAQRVTRRFRPAARRVRHCVPGAATRYAIGPRRVTPHAGLSPRAAESRTRQPYRYHLRPGMSARGLGERCRSGTAHDKSRLTDLRVGPAQHASLVGVAELARRDQDEIEDHSDGKEAQRKQPKQTRADLADVEAVQPQES